MGTTVLFLLKSCVLLWKCVSETQEVEVVETDDIDMEKLITFVEESPLLWDKSPGGL